jgi:hypothetical protein
MAASDNRPVELWAQTQDEQPIKYEFAKTLSRIESAGADGVDLHVFPPGDATGAEVTLSYSADEAERIGMDLIRAAGEARA